MCVLTVLGLFIVFDSISLLILNLCCWETMEKDGIDCSQSELVVSILHALLSTIIIHFFVSYILSLSVFCFSTPDISPDIHQNITTQNPSFLLCWCDKQTLLVRCGFVLSVLELDWVASEQVEWDFRLEFPLQLHQSVLQQQPTRLRQHPRREPMARRQLPRPPQIHCRAQPRVKPSIWTVWWLKWCRC